MAKFMVIESFLEGCTAKVYERFHAQGRMLPDGLIYLDSWLSKDGKRCFQLMETKNRNLFEEWFKRWSDLCSFEVVELGEKPVAK